MSTLSVQGGKPLYGEISIGGAKNAVLPLMASSLITNRPVHFSNVPQITDVEAMKNLLSSHGVDVSYNISRASLQLTASNPRSGPRDTRISGTFRASVLVLGPLLARLGRAIVFPPGGDDIDSRGRGIDFHITGLTRMGALIQEYDTHIDACVPNGCLTGPGLSAPIVLPKVSVGATQNIMMAACAADGITVIENASFEPETLDLVKFLRSLEAQIEVDKDNRKFTIRGKPVGDYSPRYARAIPICHTVIPDRIEAGTYAIAAAITGGRIELKMPNASNEVILDLLQSEFWRLLATGVEITRTREGFKVERCRNNGVIQELKPVSVRTRPYPGFPTDMHPQWAALMCFSTGSCWIKETVFDNRFRYVEQLRRMGGIIQHDGKKKVDIQGGELQQYTTVTVKATNIRAGAALILAALARNGVTAIQNISEVERGYEKFVEKFTSCCAQMQKQ